MQCLLIKIYCKSAICHVHSLFFGIFSLTISLNRVKYTLQRFPKIDAVDPEMLREAKKAPDRFPNLVVRISGWSARFASLNEEWQDMIINRTTLEAL